MPDVPPADFEVDATTGIYTNVQRIMHLEQFVRIATRMSRHETPAFRRRPILYRGQKNVAHDLIPKIARNSYRNELKTEKDIFNEFKRLGFPFLPRLSRSLTDLEFLSIAQHHGLATRLLDWSDNALAALWFAVKDRYTREERFANPPPIGVVWIYMPEDADFVTPEESMQDPFDYPSTKVFRPSHIADRIRVQSGWFTVHRRTSKGNRFIPLNSRKSCKANLRCLQIDSKYFPRIEQQLLDCGISAASLFPDLSGLCDHLNRFAQTFQGGGIYN